MYLIESFDRHYYALSKPTGTKWVNSPDNALQFQLPESAQSIIDLCRFNAKVIEL